MPEFLPFVRRWFDETFAEATRAQREGWDAIASGRDTLIVAPTGSGKTLAAFLWALDYLCRLASIVSSRIASTSCMSRRCARSTTTSRRISRAPLAGIRAAAAAEGQKLPEIRVAVRTGDTLAAQRQAMTRRPPHVLITTPESLFILLTSERFRPALAHTRFLIVDEIHALMGGKRGAHLALSLERLQALVQDRDAASRPQRIGCSATVSPIESARAFLTGATATDAVTVDAGFTRDLDIKVIAPVDDFLTAPSDTIWEAALQQIAELVQAHRTTLVFAQSRRAAERLARDLNDRIPDGRVAAHHGSLSRRARLEAENRLKDGELRALVATSSLELGIDVGAIDLVVQLQSPRNIAAALQRVGRAGHLLSRTSKGRIVVTKGEELLEAAAVVRSIHERHLDRVVMPDAPLDVLAQQIVAAVAAESLTIEALHARLRNAAPYRQLERDTLVAVIRSLAEPLPAEVKGAAPRILWDRVNDRLHARRGSRFLALTSGGTIPDNGLYDVFVAETDLKVGTLDEEFVTESLPGDVFLLGSHSWKIVKVRADRVLVEDAQGMSPTIPFWKGEHPSRSWELGVAVGRLRRDAAERLDRPDFTTWAATTCGLDAHAASAMHAWLVKAGEVLDGVPDDQGIVVESFSDEMGGRHAMIHSVFGMKVNGAWGMVLKEKLRRVGLVAEASHVDDGILLSFAPGQVPPSPERLVTFVAPEEVDTLLGKALIGYAALRHALPPLRDSRALHPADVPRPAHTRLSATAQGRRAARVGRRSGRVPDRGRDAPRVFPRRARRPPPASAARARARRRDVGPTRGHAAALAVRLSLAARVGLGVPGRRPRRGAPGRRGHDAQGVVRGAGPAEAGDRRGGRGRAPEDGCRSPRARRQRAGGDPGRSRRPDRRGDRRAGGRRPAGLIGALAAERRVLALDFASGRRAWVSATDVTIYAALDTTDGLERLALRLLRTRGPVTAAWLAERYGLALAAATSTLDRLAARGLVRQGSYLAETAAPQFVHIAVLDEIQRRQVHARRVPRPVASAEQLSAFLLRRHHLHPDHRLIGPPGVLAALELLQGEDLPVRVWEQDLLSARVENYEREWLDRLGLAGEMVWTVFDPSGGERPRTRVGAALRDNVGWLREASATPAPHRRADQERVPAPAAPRRLVRPGSRARDRCRPGGGAGGALGALLGRHGDAGHLQRDRGRHEPASARAPERAARRRRRGQTRGVLTRLPVIGRWSALADDEPLSPEEREEARAQLLLARYGVVTRELAHGDWTTLRHTLLRMEYGGEVVRGYFVAGLSGEQYALADALRDLDTPPRAAPSRTCW